MQVKASQAIRMLTVYIKAQLVPLMVGSPGCGKSEIYQQIADYYNLLLIDIRLSQCDVTDLNGFPQIIGKKAGYVPMNTFPLEGDPIPEGYSGWLVLFDELTSASTSLQAASYKIILDRKVGQDKLHKNVALCAAGNLETDGAIVEPMSTALQSRMVHLELVVDQPEWVDWAEKNGIDFRITGYTNFKPDALYTFRSDHTDNTYACPRTWAFMNRLMYLVDENSPDMLPLAAGTISEGVAREFLTYCKIYKTLPTVPQIRANPSGLVVPEEPSVIYALIGTLAHNATKDNLTELMIFIKRIPAEFQVVCLRETVRRNKTLLAHPAIKEWIASSAVALF